MHVPKIIGHVDMVCAVRTPHSVCSAPVTIHFAGPSKSLCKVRVSEMQESIKSSSSWFLACRNEAQGMANMMLHRVQQIPDFAAQLHVLYLMNDILFETCAPRTWFFFLTPFCSCRCAEMKACFAHHQRNRVAHHQSSWFPASICFEMNPHRNILNDLDAISTLVRGILVMA